VLGIPQNTGSVQRHRTYHRTAHYRHTPHNRRTARR
jgi:hypothetical protein